MRDLPRERLLRTSTPPMLDDFIPGPQLVEVDHVDLAATPERAYAAMRELDLARSPVLRLVLARRLDISAGRFAAMAEPGYGKVVLQLRFGALGDNGTRIEAQLRLSATDDLSWAAIRRTIVWSTVRTVRPSRRAALRGARWSRRTCGVRGLPHAAHEPG